MQLGVIGLALVAALSYGWRSMPSAQRTGAPQSRTLSPLTPVSKIGLDRLASAHPPAEAGRRDLFAFGPPPTLAAPPPPPPTLAPVTGAPGSGQGPDATPTPFPLPPLTLKYIGALDNGRGTRVAVLLTDRSEILTGKLGEVVANRYRIAKMGIESVDLEDVSSGETRRLALKGS
jgi:hypothetical protein